MRRVPCYAGSPEIELVKQFLSVGITGSAPTGDIENRLSQRMEAKPSKAGLTNVGRTSNSFVLGILKTRKIVAGRA